MRSLEILNNSLPKLRRSRAVPPSRRDIRDGKGYSISKKGGAKILIKQAITYHTRGGNKRADLKDGKKFRREEEEEEEKKKIAIGEWV